ncbi:hypothetical protein M1L59_11580 [Acinetobacter schindleri]|uniref:hypothetical protein n=1 Tax=Acinetobacter schindleri TaxID=108981 RepID=UPI00200A75E7|nr:hypothetical protein [Acinetobacter schindleri]MCK8641326.1 hypothetical protein [Acinetobacter schindleri]WDE17138.1 hypothetical protein KMZ14_06290 [Acinetobacter schindleri]
MSSNRCFGDLEEGKKILETPKYFESAVRMQRDIKKNSLYQFSGAPVHEIESEQNIVGLSIFLRTNIAPDSMKHSFGLIQRVGNRTNWLYDLCIYPAHQRSHVDKVKRKVFYGPHIHTLDDTIDIELCYELHDWNKWFHLFAKNINLQIRSNDIIEPLAGELLL